MRYVKALILDFLFLLYWGPVRIVFKRTPIIGLYWLADRIASVLFLFKASKLKSLCRKFCAICGHDFSESQIRSIALEGLRLNIKKNFERLIMSSLSRQDADKIICASGIEHIEAALSEGRGAIIQVAHFGSFLLPIAYLGLLGYKITQFSRGLEDESRTFLSPILNYIRQKDDERFSIAFFYYKNSLRPIVSKLKNNEIIAIAIDGRRARDFVAVDFLGKKARIASGIIRLAEMTASPILPVFMVRQSNNTQMLIVEQPYYVMREKDKHKMIRENLEKLLLTTTRYIHKYPSHFFMNFRKKSKINIKTPLFEDFDSLT